MMPSVSQAQRAYLYMHFGKDWVKTHHYDTKGSLPARVGKRKKGKKPVRKKGR